MQVLHSPLHAGHHVKQFIRLGRVDRPREIPARVERTLDALREAGHRVDESPWHGLRPIADVHTPEYLRFLETAWTEWRRIEGAAEEVLPYVFPLRGMTGGYPTSVVGRAGYHLHDLWVPIGEHTWRAAVAAANLAADAAHRVLEGERAVFALCRPPGHHASADMGGGSCFLNNAAIAAQYLRRRMRRVAIVDVDVHHGNGTQAIFYGRDDVLFASLHRDPSDFHPYFVGYPHERGEGAGLGYTLNLPLAPGAGDEVVLGALDTICERVSTYAPDGLVVSLGVDGHELDPSAGLAITYDGFCRIGARLAALGLPMVIVQEGGYNIDTIGRCVSSALAGFEQGLPR